MSSRVWITARSEVIPFEKMSDAHVDAAISYCDLRMKKLEKYKEWVPTQPHRNEHRVHQIGYLEYHRVDDLKKDLEVERGKRLADKIVNHEVPWEDARPQGWVTLTANFDGTFNGTPVKAGKPFDFFLAPGRVLQFVR